MTSQFEHINENIQGPTTRTLAKLAHLIDHFATQEGNTELALEQLQVLKVSQITDIQSYRQTTPGICLVAQGAKTVWLSHQTFNYDAKQMVAYAAEIPIKAQITQASSDRPFLCLLINFEHKQLGQLIAKVFPNGLGKKVSTQPFYLTPNTEKLAECAVRLLQTLAEEDDPEFLAPLIIEEIIIRLLRSPFGPAIAQIAVRDSHTQKVAKAIDWLKHNFEKPVKVNELANIAGMSPSSFHTHFKAVTSMSPLQYQKALRLYEARHIITTQNVDISSTCYQVGYASVSQFSREYTREFGLSPTKDMNKFKIEASAS